MLRPHAPRPLTSLALAAVLLSVVAPLAAACPGAVACPMAAAMPSPLCHGESAPPGSSRWMAADDCCIEAPPTLPVAMPETRGQLAPEAPAAALAGLPAHPAGALPAAQRPLPEIGPGAPIAACERLSLLQTFLI